MSDTIATWSAVRLAEAIRTKQVSSRELLDLYLHRIDVLGGPVNAVVALDIERAQAAAAQADERTARGEPLGPLHGLPITVKDALETEGIRSTGGATELRHHFPTADAPAVAQLKRAGAIVFGKTNVPRWSGDVQTYNDIYGTTNNPWALDRSPGGSSGGPAVSVACGFTSFEMGTDIGGSIRNPSHYCGVYGCKPSFGVVPQRGYLDHVGGGRTDADINVFGPIARAPEDLELLMGVLAAPEPERTPALRSELPVPKRQALADFRVGVWFDDPACRVGHDVGAVFRNAVDRIADAGAKIEEAHPPVDFEAQLAVFWHMIIAAVAPSLDPSIAEAAGGSHLAWLRAEEERAKLRAVWAEWFSEYDALLCPVSPRAAFPHDQTAEFLDRTVEIDGETRPYSDLLGWVGLIGIMALPSVAAPVGRTAENLPVGIQIVSPYLYERQSIRIAQLIQPIVGGYETPPGF